MAGLIKNAVANACQAAVQIKADEPHEAESSTWVPEDYDNSLNLADCLKDNGHKRGGNEALSP